MESMRLLFMFLFSAALLATISGVVRCHFSHHTATLDAEF